MNKIKFYVIAFVVAVSGLSILLPANNANAFIGPVQDLPFCELDINSGISMPVGFGSPGYEFADMYPDQFDPVTSTWYVGFDIDFWDPAPTREKLFLWYTDKDSTDSHIKLDRNITTGQSSIGVINNASSPNGEIYIANLTTASSGPHVGELYFSGPNAIASGPTGWGQRENLSCYEYLSSNGPIEYTTSYSEVYPPIDEGGEHIYTPEIGYSINTNLSLSVLYTGSQDVFIPSNQEGGKVVPKIKYTVYGPDGTTVLNTVTQGLSTPYSYQFAGQDDYFLEVTYVHPGFPYAPFETGAVLKPVRFELDVNGTFMSGGTSLNTCTDTGTVVDCGAANPLEDCSTYGTDIGGYFQCVVNNFGIQLQEWLKDLFVPKYSFFNGWTTDFSTFLNEKLGFLYKSLSLVGTLFTGLVSAAGTEVTSITFPGEFFGSPFVVDIGALRGIIGDISWFVLQGIVISITIIALTIAAYRKYIEAVDQR